MISEEASTQETGYTPPDNALPSTRMSGFTCNDADYSSKRSRRLPKQGPHHSRRRASCQCGPSLPRTVTLAYRQR